MPPSPPNREPLPLADDSWCFVCGERNPQGLRTVWTLDAAGTARAQFLPQKHHQGWRGVVHGGILSALLDEAMAQRVRLAGGGCVTASLNVRFRKPAPTGRPLQVEAVLRSEARRVIRLSASIRGEDGRCYAEADGVYIRIVPEDQATAEE